MGRNAAERRSGWRFHNQNALPPNLREEAEPPGRQTCFLYVIIPILSMEHILYQQALYIKYKTWCVGENCLFSVLFLLSVL